MKRGSLSGCSSFLLVILPGGGSWARMAGTMSWNKGLGRVRVVGAAAFALGAVLLVCLLVSQGAGYGPNPGFIHLYVALWPVSLNLMVAGGLLLGLSWALRDVFPGDIAR